MQNNWRTYTEPIRNYIAKYPQINITRQSIVMPAECKQEFYAIFKSSREKIIEHEYHWLLQSALDLRKNYLAIEKKIARTRQTSNYKTTFSVQSQVGECAISIWKTFQNKLNLSDFKADAVILDSVSAEFINDPLYVISKAVYDPLFELLQTKINEEEFKKTAHEKVMLQFNNLFRLCYTKWVLLNICKMAEMGEIYTALSQELSTHALLKRTLNVKPTKDLLPAAVKTSSIPLNYSRRMHALSTVDFLIYSKKYKKYIGFKTLFEKAASEISASQLNRRTVSFSSVDNTLNTNPLLIYVSDNIQEVILVADSKNFYLPDLVIHINGIDTVDIEQTITSQPIEALLGSFIITAPGVAINSAKETSTSTMYLNIGYDATQLDQVLKNIGNPNP
jgi:hypothetical protein